MEKKISVRKSFVPQKTIDARRKRDSTWRPKQRRDKDVRENRNDREEGDGELKSFWKPKIEEEAWTSRD